MEQSNPRSELSFPGIHIPSPKHLFTMSVGKITYFFPGSQLSEEAGHSQFLANTERGVLLYSWRKKKREKKAFRCSTPAPQHTAPRSHLAVCQTASIIPSSTLSDISAKKKPIIFGKKDTVSTDGCCMLATSHAADHSEMCAAHA